MRQTRMITGPLGAKLANGADSIQRMSLPTRLRVALLSGLLGSLPALCRADEAECATVAPVPVLTASAYPDHRFQPGKENQAVETVHLGEGVELRIEHSGCADAIDKQFKFIFKKPRHGASDRAAWLRELSARIKALEPSDDGRRWTERLAAFLEKARKLAPRKDGSVAICHDGSAPDEEGCPLKSRGGASFAVKKSGGGIEAVLDAYDLI